MGNDTVLTPDELKFYTANIITEINRILINQRQLLSNYGSTTINFQNEAQRESAKDYLLNSRWRIDFVPNTFGLVVYQ